ncbi:unnamed protein product [Rotaria sp. Silwood1]|nr:unnamed protein product [Rotaria sp. Silwood1]CAF1611872.1 unnamed protein product [Rotaria sp. Silwood1]CAF3719546.1 unnamed protein product [Rotaria sp. Silwood1]CAF4757616.1 unnamed protein product [Rotaria sp. Silwood1]CAF4942653.1 unnamed protein product [Rotaria sp. Silwood1]
MNMYTETIIKTPSQDAQGHWYDLRSPTQMCTGKEKNLGSMNTHLDNDFITDHKGQATMNVDDDNLFNNQYVQVPKKYHSKSLEEQVLSQKLSQLSMISHHTPEHLIMVNEDDVENVPYYLSKESESFQEITGNLSSNELIEELRQMAIVIHQIFIIDLEKSLWTIYLKSGTGQLPVNLMDNDNLTHPHLWPIQVQKLIREQSSDNTDTATCLTYVTQHLDELDDKMKQYQTKYNMKKNRHLNYLPTIQTFVHQQLESARLATEQQIAIVHYNYNDHVFELTFLAYNPTQQQCTIRNMEASNSSLFPHAQRHSGQSRVNSRIQTDRQQHHVKSSAKKNKRRKKCHGNRTLQRFRKKCRKRGLTKEETQHLINEYNHSHQGQNQTTNQKKVQSTTMEKMEVSTDFNDNTNENETTTTTKSNKRKQQHGTRSSSQRSTSHPIVKRMKRKKSSQITMIPLKPTYKLPIYLKAHPNLLFQTLRVLLKHTLRKKSERKFLHDRLQLLDQQCRVELHQNLWQSYFKLGSEKEVWPNVVVKRAKTDEHIACEQFVKQHLNDMKIKFDQFTNELRVQLQSCPVTLLPLQSTLDQRLKELVQLQQKYLAIKMQYQLSRYQDMITEIDLFQTLSSFPLTSNQQTMIDRLKHLQEKQVRFYEDLAKLDVRVSIDFLPRSFDELEWFIELDDYFPFIKDNIAVEFKQNCYKIIQEAKRTWLNTYVGAYESQIQAFEHHYEVELHQFELTSSSRTCSNNEIITLYQSFLNYIQRRIKRLKEEIAYEKIPIYRKQLLRIQRRSKSTNKTVTLKPNVIIDLIYHPFTAAEVAYLSRGPTYIRPNPSVFFPNKTLQKRIDREHDDTMNKLKKCMSTNTDLPKIPLTSSLYKLYSDRLRSCLTQSYMTPVPFHEQIRALRELKIVQSIRKKLKKYKLILRETDKSRVLHIGRAIDYERKATEYRQTTGAYQVLTSNPFNDIICTVTRLLNQLKSSNRISEWQRVKLTPNRKKTELAYMYFIPKPHKKGTPLRPILNTIHAVTKQISQYLDKLIRPLFDRFVRHTTFVDGADLLDQLQKYIQKGYFNSSTLFIIFDIANLYTMLPQEESLAILAEFLRVHNCERINGISIDTIIELARVVLQANAFVYNNKFYRQIIGGAMGSAFTLTLANIFMWKWERQTILPKLPSHELYGRYIDDVFFTCNQSEDKVKALLEAANKFHSNIKLEYKISKSVPFLDVYVENKNGILASSIYHKPSAEPTVVSFLSDHPRHVFRNVIQTALTRAVRYSSTFEVFNNERRAIRLMFLYNRYPSNYINQQFEKFFADYMSSTSSPILPMITNESQFLALREKLSNQPTAKQTQLSISAAAVELTQRTQNVAQQNANNMEATVKRKNDKFKNNIFVHATYESRLKGLAREIHMIHDNHFKNTVYGEKRLIVGFRNNSNIEFELSRKRPASSVLKDPLAKKRKPNGVNGNGVNIS